MNLVEAIHSGGYFKRNNHVNFMFCEHNGDIVYLNLFNGIEIYKLSKEDLIADDWCVKDAQVVVTKGTLEKAISLTSKECEVLVDGKFIRTLKRNLGL